MNRLTMEQALSHKQKLEDEGILVFKLGKSTASMVLATFERARKHGPGYRLPFHIRLNTLVSREYTEILALVLWLGPRCIDMSIENTGRGKQVELVLSRIDGAEFLCDVNGPEAESIRFDL